MRYYNNYLDNLAQTPNEEYRGLRQAIVTSIFEDTTLLTTIKEEEDFNFVFNEIDAWVDTVTEAIVATEKDVGDYRSLYFEDCKHEVIRGKYYNFDDNYWLCYESSTPIETTSNCKVRRCNNLLKWINENGELIEYPCILEYNLQSPAQQISKTITTANGHVTVIVQGNIDTHKITKMIDFYLMEFHINLLL